MSKRPADSSNTGSRSPPSTSSRPAKRVQLSPADTPAANIPQAIAPTSTQSQYPSAAEWAAARANGRGLQPTYTYAYEDHAVLAALQQRYQPASNRSNSGFGTAGLDSPFASPVPRPALHNTDDHVLTRATERQQWVQMAQKSRRINRMDSYAAAGSRSPSNSVQGNPQSMLPDQHGSPSPYLQNFEMPQVQYTPSAPGPSRMTPSTNHTQANTSLTYDNAQTYGNNQTSGQSTPSNQFTSGPSYVPGYGTDPRPFQGPQQTSNFVQPSPAQQVSSFGIVNTTNAGTNPPAYGNDWQRWSQQQQLVAISRPSRNGQMLPQGPPLPNHSAQAPPAASLPHTNRDDNTPRSPRPAADSAPSTPAAGFSAGPTSLPPPQLPPRRTTTPAPAVPMPPASRTDALTPDPFSFGEHVPIVHTTEVVRQGQPLARFKTGTWRCKQSTLRNKPTRQALVPKPAGSTELRYCCAIKNCEWCKLTNSEYTDLSASVARSHNMGNVRTSESNTYVPPPRREAIRRARASMQRPGQSTSQTPTSHQVPSQASQQTASNSQSLFQPTLQRPTSNNSSRPPTLLAPPTKQYALPTPPSGSDSTAPIPVVNSFGSPQTTQHTASQPMGSIPDAESSASPPVDTAGVDTTTTPPDDDGSTPAEDSSALPTSTLTGINNIPPPSNSLPPGNDDAALPTLNNSTAPPVVAPPPSPNAAEAGSEDEHDGSDPTSQRSSEATAPPDLDQADSQLWTSLQGFLSHYRNSSGRTGQASSPPILDPSIF